MLAGAAFLGAIACAQALGFRMRIPWGFYQLLDAPTLRAHPIESLCLLHSQPPALNTLLAIVLRVAAALDVSAEHVAGACFVALGLLEAVILSRLVRTLSGSRALAITAVVVMIAEPGYHVFGNLFFYEFLDHVLVLLLLALTAGYLARSGRGRALGVAGGLVALVWTRTLFHPLWAVAYGVLLVAMRIRLAPAERGGHAHVVSAALVLLAGLVAWPLKNLVVYDRFLTASMSGVNLARTIPECHDLGLEIFLGTGNASKAALEPVSRATRLCGADAQTVLVGATKNDGSHNWNHAAFLVAAAGLARCGVGWRLDHPREWLAQAAGQYAMWTRPTFVHPYGGELLGPPDPRWVRWATGYEDVFFHDLRPAVEPLSPGLFLHQAAMVRRRPVPYTLFGFVFLPLVVALAALQQIREPRSVRTATAAAALLCLLGPMLGACLTDGQEGNRMRFSTAPALLVVEVCLAASVLERRSCNRDGATT